MTDSAPGPGGLGISLVTDGTTTVTATREMVIVGGSVASGGMGTGVAVVTVGAGLTVVGVSAIHNITTLTSDGSITFSTLGGGNAQIGALAKGATGPAGTIQISNGKGAFAPGSLIDNGEGTLTGPSDASLVILGGVGQSAGLSNNAGTAAIVLDDAGNATISSLGDTVEVLAAGGLAVGGPGGPAPEPGDTDIAGRYKWGGFAIPGGSGIEDITTGSSPVDLGPPFYSNYAITAGGTKGVETVTLPAYEFFEEGQIGQTIAFWWVSGSGDGSNPTIAYVDRHGNVSKIAMNSRGTGQPSDMLPLCVKFICDGQNWIPIAAPIGEATTSGGAVTLNNPSGIITSETLGSAVTDYTFVLSNSTLGYYSTSLQLSFASDAAQASSAVAAPWLSSILPETEGAVQITVAFPVATGGSVYVYYTVTGAPL